MPRKAVLIFEHSHLQGLLKRASDKVEFEGISGDSSDEGPQHVFSWRKYVKLSQNNLCKRFKVPPTDNMSQIYSKTKPLEV